MNEEQKLCRLFEKLVEDLPGVHWYVRACRDCSREYGPEFAVPHWSSGRENDPIPSVNPGPCSRSRAAYVQNAPAQNSIELVA